jgi:hypothetical protein
MDIKIDGLPDDLIRKCDKCKHCIFEDILSKDQRKIKVLKTKVPPKHVNRIIIEQLCKKYYDDVCPMKYAAMRAFCDDRTAMQMGIVAIYLWDLGKKYKKETDFNAAILDWGKVQNIGREIEESYAQRYKELWDKGIRKITIDDETIEKQILTAEFIYESIMTTPENYNNILIMLDKMLQEHKYRDNL